MNNGDMPASPKDVIGYTESGPSVRVSYDGLTKREHFAVLAMQGLLGHPDCDVDPESSADWAVKCADALLKALEES